MKRSMGKRVQGRAPEGTQAIKAAKSVRQEHVIRSADLEESREKMTQQRDMMDFAHIAGFDHHGDLRAGMTAQ